MMQNPVKVIELVTSRQRPVRSGPLAPDPLYEEDALQEATLLSTCQITTLRSVALLFDLRTSLWFPENTGVLVVRGVARWIESTPQLIRPRVWVVAGSASSDDPEGLCFRFAGVAGERIETVGASAEFFTGICDSVGEVALPIEDENLRNFFATTPQWDSMVRLARASTRSSSGFVTR
jgi:hypothetical protein